jgi:hypothetical protein
MLNAFNNPTVDLMTAVSTVALYFFLLALGGGVATFASVSLPTLTAESQVFRVRKAYMASAHCHAKACQLSFSPCSTNYRLYLLP